MSRRSTALAAAIAAAAFAAAAPGAGAPLPNLVQQPPSTLAATSVDGRWHLDFTSVVSNLGPGPLLVVASRPDRRTQTMAAWQVVGGRRAQRVGTVRFVRDPSHSHWHLRPFETYAFQRLDDGAVLATVRKVGFCLNDTLRAVRNPPPARHGAFCGRNRPSLLRIREGITPGWSDLYGPEREGQFVDVTGVPAGRYLLVNRVNPGRTIRETRYDDDVAATAVDLEWPADPAGAPTVTVIGTCAGTATCATLGVR